MSKKKSTNSIFFNNLISNPKAYIGKEYEIIKNPIFNNYIDGDDDFKLFFLKNLFDHQIALKNIFNQKFILKKHLDNQLSEINWLIRNCTNFQQVKNIYFQQKIYLYKFFKIDSLEKFINYFPTNLEFQNRFNNTVNKYFNIINNNHNFFNIFIDKNIKNEILNETGLLLDINNLNSFSLLFKNKFEEEEFSKIKNIIYMKKDFIIDEINKLIELEKQQFLIKEEKRKAKLEQLKIKKEKLKKEKEIELTKQKLSTITSNNINIFDIHELLTKHIYIKEILNIKNELNSKTLLKSLKINKKTIDNLSSIYDNILQIEKNISNKYDKKYNFYIHNMYVADILNITPTEFKKFRENNFIRPQKMVEFKKWGSSLTSFLYDPFYLASITKEDIEIWKIKIIFNYSIEEANTLFNLNKLNYFYINQKWYNLITLNISEKIINYLSVLDIKNENLKNFSNITEKKAINLLNNAKKLIDIKKEENKFLNLIDNYQLNEEQKEKLLTHLSKYKFYQSSIKLNYLKNDCENYLKDILKDRANLLISQKININKYEQSFELARKTNRNINIIVGPTNSGKTFEAIQALKNAKSGVYLAPLRLLAMEIYEKLNSEGIPCNLITGEEKIIIPGANHTSSTIEMLNTNKEIDVAIIDEFQMLGDQQRGWAWTCALIGVPAKQVFVIGNEEYLTNVKYLFNYLKENFTIKEKLRFNQLEIIKEKIELNNLKKGDALIVFSKKDVLTYSTLLRKNNIKNSVIYGSLSPETRRKQALLFSEGKVDVLVSTDAIGMGLNLPIKRIIFAYTHKFDGKEIRNLHDAEFLQIAGRAGRYGLSDKGLVGFLENENSYYKTTYDLNNNIKKEFIPFYITPNENYINIISKNLKTKDFDIILNHFKNLDFDKSLYTCSSLENMFLLYKEIKKDISKLSLKDQFILIKAPINLNNNFLIENYKIIIEHIYNKKDITFNQVDWCNIDNINTLENRNSLLVLFSWLSFYFDNINDNNINYYREEITKKTISVLKDQISNDFSILNKNEDYHDFEEDFDIEEDYEYNNNHNNYHYNFKKYK